jgi:hypothetical protein
MLLTVIVVVMIGFHGESTTNNIEKSRQLGFERGSIDCLTLVVDDDRAFDLPSYCHRAEVIIYYPPDVCRAFLPDEGSCGRAWVDE